MIIPTHRVIAQVKRDQECKVPAKKLVSTIFFSVFYFSTWKFLGYDLPLFLSFKKEAGKRRIHQLVLEETAHFM
jgi:hypothetical protein